MTILNYALDNGLLFYGAFASMVGFMGYKLVSSCLSYSYVDKEVQTDVWEDYLDRPSQLVSNSVTSVDTATPRISPTEHFNLSQSLSGTGTQTLTEGANTATTVLPIPPVNLEVIPNPDIVQSASFEVVQNMVKNSSSAPTYYEHSLYLQQSVDAMMRTAEVVNNLHPHMDALEKAALVTALF